MGHLHVLLLGVAPPGCQRVAFISIELSSLGARAREQHPHEAGGEVVGGHQEQAIGAHFLSINIVGSQL